MHRALGAHVPTPPLEPELPDDPELVPDDPELAPASPTGGSRALSNEEQPIATKPTAKIEAKRSTART